MARLIDANELVDAICRSDELLHSTQWETYEIVDQIDRIPTVDAVEVVRCKNCKEKFEYSPNQFYCLLSGMPIDEDDFCSLGSKKEGEEA